MPDITVLSLNMQGVSGSDIGNAMSTIQPDLVALQEAPKPPHQFYVDITAVVGALKPYDMTGPIREYPEPPPLIGIQFLDAQGPMKRIVVLYKKATMQLTSPLTLVNFLNDRNIVRPKSVGQARSRGFAARTPAYCEFTHGTNRIGLFVWHAPTKTDLAHDSAIENFNKCYSLQDAHTNNHLTILAGDFNDDRLSGFFSDFGHGIQHHFDYILGDRVNRHTDLSSGTHKALLDQLCTRSQDHFAMGVSLNY